MKRVNHTYAEVPKARETIRYKNALLSEHLAAVERWLGRRLTQSELMSGTFAKSREMYIAAGMLWRKAKNITDGFGSSTPARCSKCGGKMQVVRPGDIRCGECEM